MVVEPPEPHAPTRRMLLAAGAALLTPGLARAAPGSPPGGALAFAVFRNGVRVGDHAMTFTGAAGAMTIVTRVAMTVRLGPVPVYRYSHRATERWSGILTLVLSPPRTPEGLRKNPLGVFIRSINWSKEFSA